jgi:Rhodopirellula transposase DDE domain
MLLVEPDLAGDPDSDRQWVRRSLQKLQRAMRAVGLALAPHTIRRVLRAYGISPKANFKRLTPRPHPDRDRQFRHIKKVRRQFEQAGWPVVSVDAKKKELIGLFKQAGRLWTEEAIEVNTYDFPDDAIGKAVPYGVLDLQNNRGAVYLGLDGDTPDFAVDAIVRWWREQGRHRYPKACRLLILADGGGSNGHRPRRWKTQLQRMLVDAFGLTVTVCHYPTGASKWNPVEHGLFSQISQTWAGLPLTSAFVMLSAIRSTTTRTGLRVTADLMPGSYPRHLKASKEAWAGLHIRRHKTCPQWNYTLAPSKTGK